MERVLNAISGRLSLRPPQRDSLTILARLSELLTLGKERDVQSDLEKVQREFPSVTDFERNFPSVCFALATGVGKTRLMGAFIAYLYLARNLKHFFVLAPSLTIYEKLIRDFTPGTPKYVFQGVAEFATEKPEIITGENYAQGRGVRERDLFGEANAHINIFNVSKINTEVRGGKTPRIKRLSEFIGQSYFDYLAALQDLVLLMDESHRYRGAAGFRVLNELNPILGLELTATPQTEGSQGPVAFKNIVYSYPLANAMKDGFVKEPAVATRENFDPKDYSQAQLEDLKLRDGIVLHENVKALLRAYALNSGQPIVKPFMLIVARDTSHANELLARIRSDDFYASDYREKVLTVHSRLGGAEEDEEVARRLVAVESPDEPTEIVIHVNKLKEGWDVNNLYTIVPLRAARVRTLIEQTIGRGLRLPYGRRTGVQAIDTLTIVAHDEFDEIVREANRPDSVIRRQVVIGRDLPAERKTVVTVLPRVETEILTPTQGEGSDVAPVSKAEQDLALAAFRLISGYERIPSIAGLGSEKVQSQLRQELADSYIPAQAVIEGFASKPDLKAIVKRTTDLIERLTIAIPRITLRPKGEVQRGYRDFTLDVSAIRSQPVAENVLIQFLRTNNRERLLTSQSLLAENRPEDYLVRVLIDFDDIDYDHDADLLYRLSGQMVAHLRSYLKNNGDLHNVLQYHQTQLAEEIRRQMQDHYWEKAPEAGYEVKVHRGFQTLRSSNYSMPLGDSIRNFRQPVDEKQLIRGMLFEGFEKCLYPLQKFDSDAERRFAVLCDDDREVQKWFKPAHAAFRIDFKPDVPYEPDFVIETTDTKFLCEPKRLSEMNNPDVQLKKGAALEWCRYATDHELQHGGKPWRYVLIPHDAITSTASLAGLAAKFGSAEQD